jgi:hypothetical protein
VVSEEDGTPTEYWTDDKKESLKSTLSDMMDKIKTETCTDCNL